MNITITTKQVLREIRERENYERKLLEKEHEEMDRKWREMGGRPYTDFPPPKRSQRSDDPSNW